MGQVIQFEKYRKERDNQQLKRRNALKKLMRAAKKLEWDNESHKPTR